jgi:putative inorganic carbon (hco3(-)) transporter
MARPLPAQGGGLAQAPWWKRLAGAADSSNSVSQYPLTTAFVVVTCALAPAYVVRWHLGPLPTTLLENAIVLTIAVFIFESIAAGRAIAWRGPMLIPAVLFLVAGGISVLVSPDRRAALGLFRAYLIEPIAFGIVVLNVVDSGRRALGVVAGLAAGGLVAGIANAVVVAVALRHPAYDVLNTPPVVIYNTANAVSLYLVPLIAVAGAVALHWPDRRERVAAVAFIGLGVVCVLLSFSRGGYLALAVVVLGLALSHRRRWLLVVGGLVVAIALLQVPAFGHRVQAELNLSSPQNTLVGRFHLWSAALQMLSHHVLFGAGLSGFPVLIAPYWNPTHSDRFTYPHNILLNFWSETGLLGVVAFGAILAVAIACAWRGWRWAAADWRVIHLGVLLALVAVIVHGLVDVPYWKNDLALEFWALVGLVLAWTSVQARPSGQRSPTG